MCSRASSPGSEVLGWKAKSVALPRSPGPMEGQPPDAGHSLASFAYGADARDVGQATAKNGGCPEQNGASLGASKWSQLKLLI